MVEYGAASSAAPAEAWALLAEPARWHEWAPHLRGAWGLGSPEVEAGAVGAARLAGVVPIPARIVSKDPGRSWLWRVGPVLLEHRVEAARGPGGGCRVIVGMDAPAPLLLALRASYGPVVALLVRRLARVAERDR